MGLPFLVNESVLIPRQDTGAGGNSPVYDKPECRLLDMCTGSGVHSFKPCEAGNGDMGIGADIPKKR